MNFLIRLFCVHMIAGSSFCLLFGQAAAAQTPPSKADVVQSLELSSENSRTQPTWFETYLGLSFPKELSPKDLRRMEERLMTTAVFVWVKASIEPVSTEHPSGTNKLVIAFQQRWTIIPVIAVKFGGGVPLYQLGTYDSHFLGALWNAGAEVFRYGDAPNSYLLWLNNPRWKQGHHNLQLQAERIFRVRSLPALPENSDGEHPTIQTDVLKTQLRLLTPLLRGRDPQWASSPYRLGAEIGFYRTKPTRLGSRATVDFDLRDSKASSLWLSAMLEKDGFEIDYLDYDGFKWTAKAGAMLQSGSSHPFAELEVYYYKLWRPHWVLATHLQAREARANFAENQFYLGGFSSVRGHAVGTLYGPRYAFLNTELRKVVFKSKYLWLQAAAFSDVGYAGRKWDNIGTDLKWGGGLGLRFACPLVNRMVIRVDYGIGLNGEKESGISAGFNGFFQSHRIHD